MQFIKRNRPHLNSGRPAHITGAQHTARDQPIHNRPGYQAEARWHFVPVGPWRIRPPRAFPREAASIQRAPSEKCVICPSHNILEDPREGFLWISCFYALKIMHWIESGTITDPNDERSSDNVFSKQQAHSINMHGKGTVTSTAVMSRYDYGVWGDYLWRCYPHLHSFLEIRTAEKEQEEALKRNNINHSLKQEVSNKSAWLTSRIFTPRNLLKMLCFFASSLFCLLSLHSIPLRLTWSHHMIQTRISASWKTKWKATANENLTILAPCGTIK